MWFWGYMTSCLSMKTSEVVRYDWCWILQTVCEWLSVIQERKMQKINVGFFGVLLFLWSLSTEELIFKAFLLDKVAW